LKGSNPFAMWEDDPSAVIGRKDEAKAFSTFLNGLGSRQAGVVLVTGGSGIGKSSILRYLGYEAGRSGITVLHINAEKGEDEKAISEKLWGEMVPLLDLRAQGGKAPAGFPELFDRVEKARPKGSSGVLFIIDDIDDMRKADEAFSVLLKLIKEGWGRRTAGVAAGSTRALGEAEGPLTMIALKPFDEHSTREMVEKALKKGPPKMGEECLQSLLSDTGGNPRLLKRICHDIYDRLRDNEKVISKGHYLAYMPQIMGSLSREWFGRLFQETPPAERMILQAMAKDEDGIHVSDIAKRVGKPLGPITALMRRLLDSGQIVRLDRGKYKIFSRLYAKYVSQRG
jgi:hypothetical protein